MENDKVDLEIKKTGTCRVVIKLAKEVFDAFMRLTEKDKEQFKKDMLDE